MYFFNLKALENDLIDLKISEDEAFKYFLVLSLLTASLTYFNFASNSIDLLLNFIEGIIQFVISFWSIKKTYSINKNSDRIQYYQRFFSLSFVVLFKTLLYTLILIIPYVLLALFNVPENYIIDITLNLTTVILINGLYYFLLCKSFKRIASERLLKMQIESVK